MNEEEKIVRLWRLAYIKLFYDDFQPICFVEKSGEWEAHKIFWRFYYCVQIKEDWTARERKAWEKRND